MEASAGWLWSETHENCDADTGGFGEKAQAGALQGHAADSMAHRGSWIYINSL